MGNTHGRESRHGAGRAGSYHDSAGVDAAAERERAERTRQLTSTLLGTTSSRPRRDRERPEDAPYERRETKQERDARRMERDRAARLKERERSMKEEHVDGGFLVTMGIYTASEDFSKPVVRQLIIDRRIAPFWRGLDDFDNSWAEHQIIAAARGLEIPPADQVPEHLKTQPKPVESPDASTQNINKLTVPMGPRTMSAASDKAGSNSPSSVPSPTTASRPAGSPFKPHKKALAAALSLTRNGSQAEIAPREVLLPSDPFVNGQPLEVFLYKDGIECPLCLMYYPPYMNRTRCCDQMICSECFAQIKRPDPHHPEHHGEENNAESGNSENPEELIMEPAKCPYCTQTEFGVTYDPPPFRRGLVFAMGPPGLASHSAAMSSTSSLNSSTLSPHSSSPPAQASRKRAQSLSATAPGVVTTDRIRPEWTNKLQHARQQQRRRAAAADALHHAAFFQQEQRGSIFGRPSRFARRSTREPLAGSASNSQQPSDGGADTPAGPDPGPRTSSGRLGLGGRERVDAAHLENLMMAEAIRLSLAEEEERRKKEEKEAKKQAKKDDKKREKEEKKAAKKGPYQGSGGDGQNASNLSIAPSDRKPGNGSSSNLRIEAGVAAATTSLSAVASSEEKGKSVDRGEETGGSSSTPVPAAEPSGAPTPGTDPVPERPRGGSHLRQMSNASTVSSSDMDGTPASLQPPPLDDPHSSNMSLEGRSDEDDPGQSTEPLFNFRSLAEIVGVPIDGEARSPGSGDASFKEKSAGSFVEPEEEHVEHAPEAQTETQEKKASETNLTRPSEAGTAVPDTKTEAKKEEGETNDTVSAKSGSSSEHVEVAVGNSKQGDHVISTAEAPNQIS